MLAQQLVLSRFDWLKNLETSSFDWSMIEFLAERVRYLSSVKYNLIQKNIEVRYFEL